MPQITDGGLPEGTRVFAYYTGVTTGTRSVVLDGSDLRIRRIEAADVVIPVTAPPASLGRPLIRLSPRETEVLRLVTQGLTNAEIGEELSLAADSVKTHVRRILWKLDARNRTHLVIRAAQFGALRLSELLGDGQARP